ncbi:MAG: YncE family protein [Acidobacteria bacterium]|nr:YncE family protein [Acidobacteriota bacterium]
MLKTSTKFAIFLVFAAVLGIAGVVKTNAQAKPTIVVLNKADNELAIVDPATMKVTGRVPVGEGPHEVVISEDGKTAFVANYGAQTPGNTISIIDIATAKELRRVDLGPLLRPHGIQMIGGKLYFTAEVNRAIARYDPATNKVDWIMGTGQNGSHMIAGSSDQKAFYTANIGSDSVTMFRLQNVPPAGSTITQIPVGKQPEAIDLSPDGKEVWIGLNAENATEIINTASAKSVAKLPLGGRPYRVRFTPDGKNVLNTILQTKEIVLIDATSRKEVRRIKLESTPLGVAFSKDGKTAFITAVQPDVVLRVNLETGEVTGRVETGKVPDGIAVTGI